MANRTKQDADKFASGAKEEKDVQLRSLLGEIAVIIVSNTRKALEKHKKVASRRLLKSIKKSLHKDGRGFTLDVFADNEVASDRGYSYAGDVYFGRKAGKFPDPANIAKWIVEKGITPRYDIDKSSFLIARKIAEEGIRGYKFIDVGYRASRREIREKVISFGLKWNG